MTKVEGDIAADFKWLVQLLCTTQVDASQRILIVFHNLTSCLMLMNTQGQGLICRLGKNPIRAMFHKLTNPDCKDAVTTQLLSTGGKIGRLRVVFCSSSLWMGMDFKKYLVCLSLWHTSDSRDFFVQETGRAVSEKSVHGHSIQMAYPHMFVVF